MGKDTQNATMNEYSKEERHWDHIALWLASLSLMPAAVTVYAAAANNDPGSNAQTIIQMTLAAVASAAVLFSWATAGKVILNTRGVSAKMKLAKLTTAGFAASATTMVATGLISIGSTLAASL